MKWFQRKKGDADGYYKSFPALKLIDRNRYTFNLKNKNLIAFKYKNEILVFINECPHRNLSLDNAIIEEDLIICNHHNWKFKIDSGFCVDKSKNLLIKYPAKVYKNYIWIKI
jgi:nitrite reductase/ring-hydroxylating ferredoxin subunit